MKIYKISQSIIKQAGILNTIQTSLDVAGFIPGVGIVPDLVNAAIYAANKDFLNATISTVAAIPFYGDAVKGLSMSTKTAKIINKTKKTVALSGKSAKLIRTFPELSQLVQNHDTIIKTIKVGGISISIAILLYFIWKYKDDIINFINNAINIIKNTTTDITQFIQTQLENCKNYISDLSNELDYSDI